MGGESLCRTVLGAVQKCGHYRPNRTPGTKSSVGACVLPTRQSLDCLRGRPLHAPLLFVAVRPARPLAAPSGFASLRQPDRLRRQAHLGGGTAHPCTGAYGGSSAHHHFASDFSFGVSLCIHPHKRTAKLGRNTSLRFAAHLCGGCPIPPHSKSPAPWILRLARPR